VKHSGNRVENLNIAYIGGGSRGWAWGLMSDLAAEESLCGMVKLYDIDFNAALDNEKIGNRLSERTDAKSHWRYKAVENISDALNGADFVVISIMPGTFDEMESDVHAPEEYGIYQSVGDTTGPGGLVRALRTIPMYAEIAENIKRYCPEAWVISYTNPMALCVRTLYEVFPKIKAFGCCHEVFGTQKLLAQAVSEILGIEEPHRREISVNVLGINHFTWIDRAFYNDIDIFPIYAEFAEKYYETGFAEKSNENWMNKYFSSSQRVKFDLFKRYGIIAAAGDRHLAEFCPGKWYLKDPQTVHEWGFELTPVKWRKEDLKNRLERSRRLSSGEEDFVIKETGEEGVAQIKALLGLGDLFTNVNIPNIGQIKNIPLGAVVETNALFSRGKVIPAVAGELPWDVHNLVIRHVYNQETVLKAALFKDKDLAFRAFANDPLVSASLDDSKKLLDKMLSATKKYLPGWEI